MHRRKEICFDCKGYSGASCSTHLTAAVGTAFRPPKKSKAKKWAELRAIFEKQKQPHDYNIFFGFGGNWAWRATGHTKALRESTFRENLCCFYQKP